MYSTYVLNKNPRPKRQPGETGGFIMLNAHNIKIDEVENYLNRIFSLECKVATKDLRITLLEFELALEKQLLDAFKKFYLQPDSKRK